MPPIITLNHSIFQRLVGLQAIFISPRPRYLSYSLITAISGFILQGAALAEYESKRLLSAPHPSIQISQWFNDLVERNRRACSSAISLSSSYPPLWYTPLLQILIRNVVAFTVTHAGRPTPNSPHSRLCSPNHFYTHCLRRTLVTRHLHLQATVPRCKRYTRTEFSGLITQVHCKMPTLKRTCSRMVPSTRAI